MATRPFLVARGMNEPAKDLPLSPKRRPSSYARRQTGFSCSNAPNGGHGRLTRTSSQHHERRAIAIMFGFAHGVRAHAIAVVRKQP